MHSLLAIVTLSLNLVVCSSILETGDACTKSNGEKGICTHFTDCQTAIQEVGLNGRPEICSFDATYPIVCCQVDKVMESDVSKSPMLLVNEPNNGLRSKALDKKPQSLRKKGDACRTSKGKTGTCTDILDCVTATQEAAANGRPEICSFDGSDLIICCQTDKAIEGEMLLAHKLNDSYGYIPFNKNTTALKKKWQLCLTSSRGKGRCREFAGCGTARQEVIANADNGLEICGFNKSSYPLICCPDNAPYDEDNKTLKKCKEFYPPMEGGKGYIGGKNASPKQFPYMARLGYGESTNIIWQCGGSLVSLEFVLTAAHCLNSTQHGELRHIRLGELEEDSPDDKPQDFAVREIHPHPNYIPFSKYHDIALVRLDRPAVLNDFVKPACLAVTRYLLDDTTRATAMGWGLTSIGGIPAKRLQYGELLFVPNERCRKSYGASIRLKEGIVEDTQICADAGGKPEDTCQGDSGGPLQMLNIRYPFQGFPEIVGVTSFGRECTRAPGVYTRVFAYMPWIESIVWANE